jgi:hypothetical protein
MSGLGWLMRDYVESMAGKIVRRAFVYLFLPAPSRKQRLRNWRGEESRTLTDQDGKEFAPFKGRGVHCTNPELWLGKYPRRDNDGRTYFIVPQSDCKACSFYEAPGRKRRFACCRWDRERLKGAPTPLQIAEEAMREARRMIAGGGA